MSGAASIRSEGARTAIELVLAGAAASAIALRHAPAPLALAGDDPLRSTLVAVPLVIAALAWIDRRCAAEGGRRLASSWGRVHGTGVLVLAVLTLGRTALGLDLSATVLAAGWALLLAHRVYLQVLALRPLLGQRLPERPSALFFWLPLVIYLAVAPWTASQRPPDGDEPYYLLLAHSLVHDFDVDLANNYAQEDWRAFMERPIGPQPGDPVGPHGEVYSRHDELLPLVLAPGYLVAGRAGALITMAALTALLAWVFLRLAHGYFPEGSGPKTTSGPALVAWALLALSPPLLLYSSQVWTEVPGALLLSLALDRILWLRRQPGSPWRGVLGLGLAVALLPLLNLRFTLLALPLVVLAGWRLPRARRQLAALGAGLLLVGATVLALNHQRFGNPLKMHSSQELALLGQSARDFVEGGLGLFFDSAFGLFPAAPLWLLVLPALLLAGARRRPMLAELSLLALPYLVVLAPRGEWYGGWSPPFRYGLCLLPLLALLLPPLFAERRGRGARALLATLGLATLVLTLVWLAVPGWSFAFADGRTHLLDHLGRLTGTDAARFFPSTIRPRLATWLWPPALTAAACLLWWWPRARPGRARGLGGLRAVGASLLLVGVALVPLAAARWPSTVIELEDPQVSHYGGHPHPQRWTVDRTRFRGGWVLRPGESATMPVVAAGKRLMLTVHVQWIRNGRGGLLLEVRGGNRILTGWQPEIEGRWLSYTLGPLEWESGQPLVLALRATGLPQEAAPRDAPREAPSGLVIDRVELRWLSAEAP